MDFINQVLFTTKKNVYKGNMHMHSTNSDGHYKPADAVALYRDMKYDFVALSDHRRYVNTKEYNTEDFLVLNAFEMTSECKVTGKLYHIHGIVDENRLVTNDSFKHLQRMPEPKYDSLATTQKIINDMMDGGMITVLNHPAWSHNSFEEALTLQNYFAIEIYNHKAEVRNGNGSSVAHWDYLLNKGRRVLGIATDDSHNKSQYHVNGQYFGGWIVVNAKELQSKSIVESIKNASFYSSTGPEFLEISIENDQVIVKSSKVKKIKFLTGKLRKDKCVLDMDNKDVTNGHYKISGDEVYIRIELVDGNGKVAWSNPIFIEDIRSEKVFIGVE